MANSHAAPSTSDSAARSAPARHALSRLHPARWSAAIKLAVTGSLIMAVAVAITAGLLVRAMETVLIGRAQERLAVNVRLAHDALQSWAGDGPVRLENDRLLGANGRALDGSEAVVDKVQAIAGGVATIFRGDLRVSTNVHKPDGARAVGTKLAPGPVFDAVLKRGETFRGEADVLGTRYFVVYEPMRDPADMVVGILFVGVARGDYLAPVAAVLPYATLLGLGLAAMGGAALFFAVRRSFAPLKRFGRSLRAILAGDLDTPIPGLGRHDEVGTMAEAVGLFRDGARRAQQLEVAQRQADERRLEEDARLRAAAEQEAAEAAAALVVGSIGSGLERLAGGDFTARIEAALPPAYEKLSRDFNTAVTRLHELLSGIVAGTAGIRSDTGDIARAADDLSQRTEQQAASLEETAAALEQITATMRRTADGAKQAEAAAGQARTDAGQSGAVVSDAVAAMGEIERSARQISQIIGVIDEIAFQTNLLALNAGVEAARAGDAGRGFAVVAQEVRALAQRSAEAAKEIKALISTSSQQVARGVTLVGETGRSLGRIIQQVNAISTVVDEIAHAAREQATGLAEVNAAVNQMDHVTQQNAAMVEQSTEAARALASQTEQLADLTDQFRVGSKPAPAAAAPANGAARATRFDQPAPRSPAGPTRPKRMATR